MLIYSGSAAVAVEIQRTVEENTVVPLPTKSQRRFKDKAFEVVFLIVNKSAHSKMYSD